MTIILFLAALTINDYTPTLAQIEACRADAQRLCPRLAYGITPELRACMIANIYRLSPQCKDAFK